MYILHISDVHFGMQDIFFEQAGIADSLIRAVHNHKINPDLCIFSGDLAQSGTDDQLTMGQNWLMELIKPLNVPLLIVPGNHDVQRSLASPPFLRNIVANSAAYNGWRPHAYLQCTHLKSFIDWHKSAKKSLGLISEWTDDNIFGSLVSLEIKGRTINIISLNSALLSCDDDDEGNLVVDAITLNSLLLRARQKPGINIVVIHHPLENLIPWNREAVETSLLQEHGAHLLLHGHLHSLNIRHVSKSTGSSLTTLTAGAAYQSPIKRLKTFAFYELDVENRQTIPTVFVYSPDSGGWHIDSLVSQAVMTPFPVKKHAKRKEKKTVLELIVSNDVIKSENPASKTITRSPKKKSSKDKSDPKLVELEAHRLLSIGFEVQKVLAPYFHEKFLATQDISSKCYALKYRLKDIDRILEKFASRSAVNKSYSVSEMPDICAFRIVTMYQDQVPRTVQSVLSLIQGSTESMVNIKFARDKEIRIDVNISKAESDPLSIADSIKTVARASGLITDVTVKQRPTGYSSVHIVAPILARNHSNVFVPYLIEIQVRSALEDVWGDIDYRLRYGRGRGDLGVSWMRHLNVFKGMIDALVGYVDIIKRHSEEVPPQSVESQSRVRSVNTAAKQLQRLEKLPDVLKARLESAFILWSEAEEDRKRTGGTPGLLRKAADDFLSMKDVDPNTIKSDQSTIELFEYVIDVERAYMLIHTGDEGDRLEAEKIYLSVLEKYSNDAASNYRISIIYRIKKEYERSLYHLGIAIRAVEDGADTQVDNAHWVYDEIRRGMGLTYWRMAEETERSIDSRIALLKSAINFVNYVIEKPADYEDSRDNAVNDLFYYIWYAKNLDPNFIVEGVENLDELRMEFDRVGLSVLNNPETLRYDYLDTVLRINEKDCVKARPVALKIEEILERRIKKTKPYIFFGNRGESEWTIEISPYLNVDERDVLKFAQKILARCGRT